MELHQFSGAERARWDAFVAGSPYGHVLQSWEWGEIKQRSGWSACRLGLTDDGAVRGAAQILLRALPLGLGTLAYVPKGPALDWENSDLVRVLLAALRAFAAEHNVMALKIEPEVREPSSLPTTLTALGLVAAPPVQMRSTIWVDLASGEDAMLARQKQKTRYNIRLAARKGVLVEEASGEDVAEWYRMYQATARRDGFSIHDEGYYRLVLDTLAPAGMAKLLLARHEGDLLAGIIVFRFGHLAQYMYGASSNEKRNLMAPYLLQWEGMRWARTAGATTYDLWGIPDVLEENEDLWGVYRHKRGYGGEIVRYVGAFDLVLSRARHAALEQVGRPLFKRVARLGV